MADTSAIRSALATRLATVLGQTGQASAYWHQNPHPPTLQVVGIGPTTYDTSFGRGGDTLLVTIQGLGGTTADQAAQEQIDAWLDTSGATSVKAAIELERPGATTLGGIVSSCRVTGHRRPVITTIPGGLETWMVEFTVEIQT